jgi:hypothetical protein
MLFEILIGGQSIRVQKTRRLFFCQKVDYIEEKPFVHLETIESLKEKQQVVFAADVAYYY